MYQVSWKRQLFLAIGLAALGGVVYWHEFSYKLKKEDQEETSKHLFPIKQKRVSSILLVDGTNSFEFKCAEKDQKLCRPGDQSRWDVVVPKNLPGDMSNVNSLLTTLESFSSSSTISLKEETPEKKSSLLKDYGLAQELLKAPAMRRIEVRLDGGTTFTSYLGETHPIGGNFFALIAEGGKPKDDQVLLVPSYIKSQFEHDLNYWRDKKLFNLDTQKIAALSLKGSKGNVRAQKKDGQWTLEDQGKTYPGDTESIQGLISAIGFLSAKSFSEPDSPGFNEALKGAKKILEIVLEDESKNKTELTLFEKSGPAKGDPKHLIAKVSSLQPLVELDSSVQARLEKGSSDLRVAKLLGSLDRFSIRKMEFSGDPLQKQTYSFQFQDGKWTATGDTASRIGTPADSSKLQALLDRISGNVIKEYAEGVKIPSGELTGLKVALLTEKGELKKNLVFWRKDGNLFARDLASKKNEAFKLDLSLVNALPWKSDFFKQATIPQNPAEKAGISSHP